MNFKTVCGEIMFRTGKAFGRFASTNIFASEFLKLTFMKKILLALAIVAVSFAANAQKTSAAKENEFVFGGGVRVGLPVGDVHNAYGFVIGAELQGEYMFSPQVSGTLTAGYEEWLGKTISGYKIPSTGFIPVLAGIRVYPSPDFFIGGKAGITFSTESGGGNSFTYEPQVGYNASKFQLALGYQAFTNGGTSAHLGLTGIYKFH